MTNAHRQTLRSELLRAASSLRTIGIIHLASETLDWEARTAIGCALENVESKTMAAIAILSVKHTLDQNLEEVD